MVRPKDVIPWQTSLQSDPPEAIRNIPRALEDFNYWAEHNATAVGIKREKATLLLLNDIDCYRKETLRVNGRKSMEKVQPKEFY